MKFPVFSLYNRELAAETSSLVTTPSREESANHWFLSPHACDRRRRGQGEPFGAFQCGYQPCRVLPAIGAAFPEAANNRVKVLRQMFTWACSPEYGYAEKNPARDVARLHTKASTRSGEYPAAARSISDVKLVIWSSSCGKAPM